MRTEQVPITLLLLVVIEEYVIIISLDHIGNMVFTFLNFYIISARMFKFFTTIIFLVNIPDFICMVYFEWPFFFNKLLCYVAT